MSPKWGGATIPFSTFLGPARVSARDWLDMMVTEDGDAMLGWIGGIGKQGGKQSKSRKIKGGHHETIPGARIMGHFGICPREQSEDLADCRKYMHCYL